MDNDKMGKQYLRKESKEIIIGTILSNKELKNAQLLELLKERYQITISEQTLKSYKQSANNFIMANCSTEAPEITSGLVNTAQRIAELDELYFLLKGQIQEGKLWSQESSSQYDKMGNLVNETSKMVLNDKLVSEMRGCLNDIAKEVGGRTSKVQIEHKNTQENSIHALIMDMRQAVENKEVSLLPPEDTYPKLDVIDLPKEDQFVTDNEIIVEDELCKREL